MQLAGKVKFNKLNVVALVAVVALAGLAVKVGIHAANGNPYPCDETHITLKSSTAFKVCNQTLQWYLDEVPSFLTKTSKLKVDGYYGPLTETAVKNFQTKYKVAGGATGVVGLATWTALHKETAPVTTTTTKVSANDVPKAVTTTRSVATATAPAAVCPPGRPTLHEGNSGVCVVLAQKELNKAGFDVGSTGADGSFGPATEMAVVSFQSAKCLDANGKVDHATWQALEHGITGNCGSNSNPGPTKCPTDMRWASGDCIPVAKAGTSDTKPATGVSAVGRAVTAAITATGRQITKAAKAITHPAPAVPVISCTNHVPKPNSSEIYYSNIDSVVSSFIVIRTSPQGGTTSHSYSVKSRPGQSAPAIFTGSYKVTAKTSYGKSATSQLITCGYQGSTTPSNARL